MSNTESLIKENEKTNKKGSFKTNLRVGAFLATRQIKRSNIWTNILIIFIMTLTFLNLVIVSGILVGLIEGAIRAVKNHYLGDIFISDLEHKSYIEQSRMIINTAQNIPGVESLTARYTESGKIQGNYKIPKRRPTDSDDSVGTQIVGIDPVSENKVTGLKKLVIEGQYLEPNDYDQILLGAMLLSKYLSFDSPAFPALKNIEVGDRVRIEVNGNVREVKVKGIIKSKVDEIDRRVFFVDNQLRGLIGRTDYNVDEIVLRLKSGVDPIMIKQALLANNAGNFARVQTQEDAEPKFIKDMKKTFAILGNIMSSIGLAVAAITIFIVIFINAITRRKFIGILKGIGIEPRAIELAYILQSVFYAVLGTIVGCILVFGVIKPYLDAYPINFPFSDGILVATLNGTLIRIAILFAATFIAGYIPARIVVKQNTLDAILGR